MVFLIWFRQWEVALCRLSSEVMCKLGKCRRYFDPYPTGRIE